MHFEPQRDSDMRVSTLFVDKKKLDLGPIGTVKNGFAKLSNVRVVNNYADTLSA